MPPPPEANLIELESEINLGDAEYTESGDSKGLPTSNHVSSNQGDSLGK